MFEIVELVAFAIFILFFAWLIVANVRLRLRNNKMKSQLSQEIVDREIVMQEMQKLMAEIDSKNSSHNDDFLKFVSQSRDWAFQYIERVQIAIKEFQDTFHPFAVQFYEKKKTRITKEEFQIIVDAYKKLVEELPDEGKK